MYLIHRNLLPHITDKFLLSLHRQLCALRGKGWDKAPWPILQGGLAAISAYHSLVVIELYQRNKFPNLELKWLDPMYRGKSSPKLNYVSTYTARKVLKSKHPNELSRVRSLITLIKKGGLKL